MKSQSCRWIMCTHKWHIVLYNPNPNPNRLIIAHDVPKSSVYMCSDIYSAHYASLPTASDWPRRARMSASTRAIMRPLGTSLAIATTTLRPAGSVCRSSMDASRPGRRRAPIATRAAAIIQSAIPIASPVVHPKRRAVPSMATSVSSDRWSENDKRRRPRRR